GIRRENDEDIELRTGWGGGGKGHGRRLRAFHRNAYRFPGVNSRVDGSREEISGIADFVTGSGRENTAEIDEDVRLVTPVVDDDVPSCRFVGIRPNGDLDARRSNHRERVAREPP